MTTPPPISRALGDWPGPDAAFDPATGAVVLPPFLDSDDTARWRVYADGRLWGGIACGSRLGDLVDAVAMSVGNSADHPTVIWYADAQPRVLSPVLARRAQFYAATLHDVLSMLRALAQVLDSRLAEQGNQGREGFTPTPERPGLLAIVAAPELFLTRRSSDTADECRRLALRIAREGGKVGLALLFASAETGLSACGGSANGDARALRDVLAAGNVVHASGPYGQMVKPGTNTTAHFRLPRLAPEQRQFWEGRIAWRSVSIPAEDCATELPEPASTPAGRDWDAWAARVAAAARTVARLATDSRPAAASIALDAAAELLVEGDHDLSALIADPDVELQLLQIRTGHVRTWSASVIEVYLAARGHQVDWREAVLAGEAPHPIDLHGAQVWLVDDVAAWVHAREATQPVTPAQD